jgi:hypothetical protein
MADIYTKLGKKTSVLNVREGRARKFAVGADWTEIRIGVFASAVAATGPNDASVADSLAVSTVADNLLFGIKDDSAILPGLAGSLFLGIKQSSATVSSNGGGAGGISSSGGGGSNVVGYAGASEILGGTGSEFVFGNVVSSGAAPYAAFTGVQIKINNRGLATQSVYIATINQTGVTDYSSANLRTILNNAPWGGTTGSTIAWNDGVSARVIPDCIYYRCPLFLNSLRIAGHRVIRYAP